MMHDNKGPGDGTADPGAAAPAEPVPAAAAAAAPAQPAAPGDGVQAAGQVSGQIAALKAEVGDLKDRLLRAHAEMDNMRKRVEREKADAHKYALSKFARDIVGVGDNLERAIASIPAGAAEANAALKSFLDGAVMTERELVNVLERHGIKRIDPKGQAFDPHHHQAVMEAESPDAAPGTVMQVFQAGYMIEDRILRPAMVVVAKAAAKPPPAEPQSPPANDDGPRDANGTPGA